MQNKISGIQIIGTQRSGSNLLRVILNQSSDIASPHPPHILVTFMPLLHLYAPLSNADNYQQLVSDVVDFVCANPVAWEGIVLDKEEIIKNSVKPSLIELNRLIYEQAAIVKQAKYWCCKSMNNVYYAEQLNEMETPLKYIYLYRDGRDVAASFKKAVVGEKHIYQLAKQWQQDQAACLTLAETQDSSHFFSLSYELLITKPEETVKSLCAFLDIAYKADMLSFYKSDASKSTAAAGEMWSNLEKPIISNNMNKFLTEFAENDLEIFELIAGNALVQLDYKLHTPANNTDLITDELLKKYREENDLLKKEVLFKARKSDLENRLPQAAILKEIRQRQIKEPATE